MMKQYRRLRNQVPEDTLLLFRLGDFYEMFYEDAKEGARILDIALTKRQGMPMCGVPYHAADAYIARLIRAGKKVAICDQMEDPALAKGIVRRELTGVVTPGTVLVDGMLESKQPNYLAALYRAGNAFGLAMLELSTGDFWAEETGEIKALQDSLARYAPRECVVSADQSADPAVLAVARAAGQPVISSCEEWPFQYDAARALLTRHFGVHSLEGFGCEGREAVVGAAGGVLHYVRETLRRPIGHVRALRLAQPADFMALDEATCANLDLVARPGAGRAGAPTLYAALDVTQTPMGGRLLRDWCLRPLMDPAAIERRLDAVEALCRDRMRLPKLREALAVIRDLERLIARLGTGSGNARDVRAVGQSLAALPAVRQLAGEFACPLLNELGARIALLPELVGWIERAIVEEPPAVLREGGLIQRGYHAELDELRGLATQGRQWLAEYQGKEQARAGIKTLKVRHNKVFGYYIEVSRGQSDNVPADYTRKQTLVNAERFITPELKDYETRILGAQERSMALEYDLFLEVRDAVVQATAPIQASAQAVAALDVLAAFAERALTRRYVRPRMSAGEGLRIRDGRHPIVELMPEAERFVPNDTLLDCGTNQLLIITGPNMAGKSTYIRQVALIAVMAQMGSFVPAAEAELGVVDRVFTRVGASDDLARGRSTFMVEMQETANILHNATRRSLIVLDEIGRGTSTFDGISIAWAVGEFLHNKVKAKTLFATHYHELTDLALTLPGVKNYNVLVRERDDQVIFLRKIVPGGADKSYGIQVARLAGLPPDVIDRAKEVLANLAEGEFGETGQPQLARHRARKDRADSRQLTMFAPPER
jgi:DNA mismatch repair protein MutS